MKPLFFILFFVLMISPVFVSATGFSPSSLVFELEQGEEDCGIITINSESSTIEISDFWAENSSVAWKVSLFDADASSHGISIDYPSNLNLGEDGNEIEVCISGEDVGEYHGVLLLREEQQGNSVVQMGIWLKLIVEEGSEEESDNGIVTSSSSSSSGGSSSGTGNAVSDDGNLEISELNSSIDEDFEVEVLGQKIENNGEDLVTGKAISEGSGKSKRIIIGAVLIILAITIIFIYNKRRVKI